MDILFQLLTIIPYLFKKCHIESGKIILLKNVDFMRKISTMTESEETGRKHYVKFGTQRAHEVQWTSASGPTRAERRPQVQILSLRQQKRMSKDIRFLLSKKQISKPWFVFVFHDRGIVYNSIRYKSLNLTRKPETLII